MNNNEYLKKKYPELDEDDISFLILSAQSIYKSITHFNSVKPEHENWILRCCIELREREGYTGTTSFSENGVSMSFDKSQVSIGLLSELPNNAVVYSRDGELLQ